LPKYSLLVSDLVKHTEEDHPDYLDLKESLKKFVEVNQKINSMMAK